MTVLTRRLAAVLPLALLTISATACDSLLGPGMNDTIRAQLTQAEQIWQQTGPASYSMVVTRGRGAGEPVTARLVVVDDRIESAVYVATGEPLEAEVLANFRTVPGLFDKIRAALNSRVPGLGVRYDATYAFPAEIAIDYDRTSLADNVGIVIAEFEPLD